MTGFGRSGLLATVFALGALLCGAAVTLADVVRLKNGTVLEGRVSPGPSADQVTVKTRFGTLSVPVSEIASIETQKTKDEEREEREKAIDPRDPEALLELARWCRANDMPTDALSYEMRARKARLDRRLAEVKEADAAGLYAAAEWAEREGYDAEIVDGLLRRALLKDPESAKVRLASELREARAKAEADRKAAEAARAQAESESERARRERERLEAERRQAEIETEQARGAVRDAARERDRVEAERRAMEADRARVDQLRRDVERDRYEAARALQEAERIRTDTERIRTEHQRRIDQWERDHYGYLCPKCGHKNNH